MLAWQVVLSEHCCVSTAESAAGGRGVLLDAARELGIGRTCGARTGQFQC